MYLPYVVVESVLVFQHSTCVCICTYLQDSPPPGYDAIAGISLNRPISIIFTDLTVDDVLCYSSWQIHMTYSRSNLLIILVYTFLSFI